MPATRRLAAILAADVAGYSRLMGEDEAGTGTGRHCASTALPLIRLSIVAKLRAITPQVMQSHLPFRRPEDRELLLSGLRLAMGEAV
jgi:hypothetical protein